MRLKIACTVLVMLMLFALTGCLFGPEQKTSAPIDPPPAGVEEKYERQGAQKKAEEDAKADKKNQARVQLYFLANNGYVVPYAVDMPKVEGIAKEAMTMLVAGSKAESRLPEGFRGVLPERDEGGRG